MKTIYALLLCFLAVSAGAGIVPERPYPLTINGKSFGNAVMINGNLMVSTQDIALGLTGTPNFGPSMQVQGNRLIGLLLPAPSSSADTFTVHNAPGAKNSIQIRKAGEISSHLINFNGKTYVPLTDFVHNGFGAKTWTAPANLATGQAITLNFLNGDGIIAVHQ